MEKMKAEAISAKEADHVAQVLQLKHDMEKIQADKISVKEAEYDT